MNTVFPFAFCRARFFRFRVLFLFGFRFVHGPSRFSRIAPARPVSSLGVSGAKPLTLSPRRTAGEGKGGPPSLRRERAAMLAVRLWILYHGPSALCKWAWSTSPLRRPQLREITDTPPLPPVPATKNVYSACLICHPLLPEFKALNAVRVSFVF
jgi:hypothetical protein